MKTFVVRIGVLALVCAVALRADVPVKVETATGTHGMVVAAHPQAAAIGLAVLEAGGNAIDAAVATSLAVGVAEPYASGLGGKLMMLYYEAKTGKTYAVDAMDAAGSVNPAKYVKRPPDERIYGWGAVCVPGLGAGLWLAHQKWGVRPWAEDVQPAIALARKGFCVLPKSREFFAEQEKKLRRGDPEIARLYLPRGELPEPGTLLPNEDMAHTLELFAQRGRDGFYRGPVAAALVASAQRGGGVLTLDDLAHYEARIVEPLTMEFRGYTIASAPPPTSGAVIFLPILKALETRHFAGPLRSPENLDTVGRVWRVVEPQAWRIVGDAPESRFLVERFLAPDSIAQIRAKAFGAEPAQKKVAWTADAGRGRAADRADDAAFELAWYESPMAATTQWMIVDREGNVACTTQSESLHFGAGVVAPGVGVVMNDTMSNFNFTDPTDLGYVAPGKRPRSTIAPTIVFRNGKPLFAIGIPGSARIPTALLQALLDRLVFGRSLADAIGDTRFHYSAPYRRDDVEAFEAEQSFPHADAEALQARGWRVVLPEAPGRGHHFGGMNAIEIGRDGTLTGYADPRRTNAAAGH